MVLGKTTPRIWTPPLVTGPSGPCGCGCALTPQTSYGFAVETFARDVVGMPLDPWERWAAIHAGELLPDGRPRFRKVLIVVGRQNGKTHLLVVLSLYWLCVVRVAMVLGTSTKLDYAKESWSKACRHMRRVPALDALLPPTRNRGINPSYWGEKCTAQDRYSPVKSHDAAAFEASVRRYVDEWVESYLDDDPDAVTVSADLRRRVVDDVLTRSDYGDEAVAAARDFSWTWPTYAVDPIHEFQFENVWESLTLESDNLHFLWCLYAIVWGIRVYESAGDTSEVTVDVPLYAHRPVDPLPAHWIHAGLADDQAAAPRLVETVAVAGGRL